MIRINYISANGQLHHCDIVERFLTFVTLCARTGRHITKMEAI